MSGSIEVVCGSMFSGKTEELMRRLRRAQYARQKIQVFKPEIDQRYSADHIQSHDSNKFPSTLVRTSKEILERVEDNTRVVGIDEAQFLDDGVCEVAEKLAFRGIRVVIAGLDLDYRSRPFGPMPGLLALAESVTKLNAVCVVCGEAASRTQRLTAPDQQVLVGAADIYEPRCRLCHEPMGASLSARPGLTNGLKAEIAQPSEKVAKA